MRRRALPLVTALLVLRASTGCAWLLGVSDDPVEVTPEAGSPAPAVDSGGSDAPVEAARTPDAAPDVDAGRDADASDARDAAKDG